MSTVNGGAGPHTPEGGSGQSTGGKGGASSAYAVFRPRWGKRVPSIVSIVVLLAFAFAAVTLKADNWTVLDRLFLFAIGVLIAWFVRLFALIEARPSPEGLVVRNLFLTRRLEWAQIVRMQFGGGAPWVSLDLSDTDTVAVMAIQKADGEQGQANARRLAALIEFHAAGREPRRPDTRGD